MTTNNVRWMLKHWYWRNVKDRRRDKRYKIIVPIKILLKDC